MRAAALPPATCSGSGEGEVTGCSGGGEGKVAGGSGSGEGDSGGDGGGVNLNENENSAKKALGTHAAG